MTEGAEAVSAAERRSLWVEIVRWPLRGGMLPGAAALVVVAAFMAMLEGGATKSSRETRSFGQVACLGLAAVVLGIYTRRAVVCTWPEERPVPWGRDEQDPTTWTSDVAHFAAVLFFGLLPLIAWIFVRSAAAPAPWIDWIALAAGSALCAAAFPMGLAATIATGSVLSAMPPTIVRMWKAEPRAARIAAAAAFVAAALLVGSALLAAEVVPHPVDVGLPTDYRGGEIPDLTPTWLRVVVFALRAVAFHAVLVAARVAGLLLREVPQVREVVA